MGSFVVDVASFEEVALPTLRRQAEVDVYIIDEVRVEDPSLVGDQGW